MATSSHIGQSIRMARKACRARKTNTAPYPARLTNIGAL
jgi:hypothetical protein